MVDDKMLRIAAILASLELRCKTRMKTEEIIAAASTIASNSHFAPVYSILKEAMAARAFPGCAFGIFADGKVVLGRSWAINLR